MFIFDFLFELIQQTVQEVEVFLFLVINYVSLLVLWLLLLLTMDVHVYFVKDIH